MSAREWTEAITSSPGVVAVFDGISEHAAQVLCEAIETEIAPLVKQRNDLLAALKQMLHPVEYGLSCPCTRCGIALAAIARAEGRQS
ncbi:MAG: hypothetical protein IPQ23_22330 [Cytophagaceae bacterium]|nr:hypothetical protein [Cytophagaceae bacterium]